MSDSITADKFIVTEENGSLTLNVLVDGMHCPSCVALIEKAMEKQEQVANARLNLSTKRLRINWNGSKELGNKWISTINGMGYRAMPFDPESSETFERQEEKFLLRCLAVAGFASGNLMMFSVPLWMATGIEMGAVTRSLFQWIQLLIAIPSILYSGIPFYRSALTALKEKQTNMDVPISVAVILTTIMSLFEILHRGQHSYLDSSVMLLFFLLIGRYLDARARGHARSAAHDLLQMMTGFATVLENGSQETIPISDIREGMVLLVTVGEKIGADGEIVKGESELDTSLITGETIPQKVVQGTKVFAGTINISTPIQIKVTKAGERSLLSEIIRMMENAEQSQAKYVTVADKISSWYTPVVHILAAAAFLGWWLFIGIAWQPALLIATTVLIITCPCALGLAVPVVQVLATGKLMRYGILVKSGSALERLAEVTQIIFDKTGTLTLGRPQLLESSYTKEQFQLAASLAVHSKHPLSVAVSNAYKGKVLPLEVKEKQGYGLESVYKGKEIKLGKRSWVGGEGQNDDSMELWLSLEGKKPVRFTFSDKLRIDTKETVNELQQNYKLSLLSGDRKEVVDKTSSELGISDSHAVFSPLDKSAYINNLKAQNEKVLMVGDGLNDAPSLACATVSISPASAMDITQNTADIVFQGEKLHSIITALNIAKFSQVLVRQNFVLAILYNVIAIPLAVMGYVTPLVAAIAMSSSSIVVILNAMRLKLKRI